MEPLSRKLNGNYPIVSVYTDESSFGVNHLLFIDDLKLFAENEESMSVLIEESSDS